MYKFNLKSIVTNEFDYNILMNSLKTYSQPWSKITALLKSGAIVRVKKGLYIKNPDDWGAFSESVLANMIYGPSYISREFALSYYGLIPESVSLVTSVTLKPSKMFKTPVGNYDYRYQSRERYAFGCTRITLDDHRHFLLATPEKSLIDTIFAEVITSSDELLNYLEANLRIEKDHIRDLNPKVLQELSQRFRRPIAQALVLLNKELKR